MLENSVMLSTDGEVEKWEPSGTVVGKVDWDTHYPEKSAST